VLLIVKLKTSFQNFCGDRNHDLLKYTEYMSQMTTNMFRFIHYQNSRGNWTQIMLDMF